jgi:SAM-dependent methyltransferase
MLRELLVGCGSRRTKGMLAPGEPKEWGDLTTLDINPDHKPDVIWDLTQRPLPFDVDTFDSIRAFEVIEHLGQQGDFRSFFAEWSEWWRILKPGGLFMATTPHWSSRLHWADPGHTRAYGPEVLTFLVQPEYARQVGVTAMSDYRHWYKADFDIVHNTMNESGGFHFGLQAVKPSRIG